MTEQQIRDKLGSIIREEDDQIVLMTLDDGGCFVISVSDFLNKFGSYDLTYESLTQADPSWSMVWDNWKARGLLN